MKTALTTILLVFCFLLGGCGNPPPPKPSGDIFTGSHTLILKDESTGKTYVLLRYWQDEYEMYHLRTLDNEVKVKE